MHVIQCGLDDNRSIREEQSGLLNFTPWDQMLRQYVDEQGRVNYQTWQIEAAEKLAAWLTETAQISLQNYPEPEQQLALWLNLYNALVIAQVLKQYPIASIRPTVLGVPNWLAFFQFFARTVYGLDGQPYSLNAIEHGTIRPQFKDPRIHFALVCAAVGCPLLRNEAYLPEQVQTQLTEDADRFINHPQKVRYDAETQMLYCSQIFKWYRQDFLQVAPSIPAFVQSYLSPTLPFPPNVQVRYLPYDWQLNQRISS